MKLGGKLFKAIVLSGFIIATTVAVQNGYDALLISVDSFVANSYGVLSETDEASLRADGQDINENYQKLRKNY